MPIAAPSEGFEATPVLDIDPAFAPSGPIRGRALDRPLFDELVPGDWMVGWPAAASAEIIGMIDDFRRAPLPLYLLKPEDFALDACRETMVRAKRLIDRGPGFVVLDGFPEREFSTDELRAAFWVLGCLLARPVATKWNGAIIYDVLDSGKTFGAGVRGSATNVELAFHTDNAFGASPPDYVGLFCLQAARFGGVSRVCDLYWAHDEMLRSAPSLLERLYQPLYYDRQAEHAPTAPKVLRVPMFRTIDGRFEVRLTPNLVRRGYDLVGEPIDARLADALDYLENVIRTRAPIVELTLKAGQMQFLHNHSLAHYRSAYVDSQDGSTRRHLLRVWFRDHGRQTYDG